MYSYRWLLITKPNYQITISKVHYTLLLQMFHSNMRFNGYFIDILYGFLNDDAVVKGSIFNMFT